MNSYKKGWGYPPVAPVEAQVKPSKTKGIGLRSRAGPLRVVDFSERLACKQSLRLRSGQAPVPV